MVDSALDSLGREVTGIISPVSICMAITVWLVRTLNPEGLSNDRTVYIATAYYHEQASDTTGTKLLGSIVNALIFVAIVTAMTFVLVLLFKYGYTKFIYGYMAFAGFSIFFLMTGTIAALLIQKLNLHLDYISFFFVLTNFAVVGVLALFYIPVPLTMKQGYLVVTGVVTAYIFTFIPGWTTWTVLIAMSLYDLAAVLSPVGPLKMLVELAQERDEDIPALVYEGRAVGRATIQAGSNQHARLPLGVTADMAPGMSAEQQGSEDPGTESAIAVVVNDGPDDVSDQDDGEETSLLPRPSLPATAASNGRTSSGVREGGGSSRIEFTEDGTAEARHAVVQQEELEEDDAYMLPDAIKLGLGDFIFYSVLVGRAAMHNLLTAFTSYVAIVAGLGMTLLLLGLHQKALPALPISIALGCTFYLVTSVVVEPSVSSMVGSLLFL